MLHPVTQFGDDPEEFDAESCQHCFRTAFKSYFASLLKFILPVRIAFLGCRLHDLSLEDVR